MTSALLIATTIAIVWKVVDGAKELFPKMPTLATQALAWALGIVVSFLIWASDLSEAFQVGSWQFSEVSFWTVILVGFAIGSSSSVSFDTMKALDNTRSSDPSVPTCSTPPMNNPPTV